MRTARGIRASPDHDLALRVLAAGHGSDLVLGQPWVPTDDGLDGLVDRHEERVHRTVALGQRLRCRALDHERHRTLGDAVETPGVSVRVGGEPIEARLHGLCVGTKRRQRRAVGQGGVVAPVEVVAGQNVLGKGL